MRNLLAKLAIWIVAFAPVLACAQAPTVEEIMERMTRAREANDAAIRSYSLTRNYRLMHDGRPTDVQAQISVMPHQRRYVIERSSGGFGEKIIRKVLDGETKASQDKSNVTITPHNYDATLVREEPCYGSRCFVLQLKPKRDDKNLVEGHAWIDANSYLVRRIEGKLAKSPSFWIKQVSVVLHYAQAAGMWLHVATQATADVRFKGSYVLTSRDVDVRSLEPVMASAPAPRQPRQSVRREQRRSTPPAAAASIGAALP